MKNVWQQFVWTMEMKFRFNVNEYINKNKNLFMRNKLFFESLSQYKKNYPETSLYKTNFKREFIWDEVIGWLLEQFKSSETSFTFEESSYEGRYSLIFQNEKGMKLFCERTWQQFDYNDNDTVKFYIQGNEPIFKYKISPYEFNDPESFIKAFNSKEYKNYALPSIMIKGEYVEGGMGNYKNLLDKRKLWKNRIDTKKYLKDTSFQAIVVNDKIISYNETINLSKEIIRKLKTNDSFRAFIKGQDKSTANKKIASKALKGDLSVDTVVKFLSSVKPEHKVIKSDSRGPYATTGSSEFIDTWKITKLSQKFPDFEDFFHNNIQNIYKGLQKNIYAHSIGYYKLLDYDVNDNVLSIHSSSTTYHN